MANGITKGEEKKEAKTMTTKRWDKVYNEDGDDNNNYTKKSSSSMKVL